MFKNWKAVYHVSSWILFIIDLFALPCVSFHCIHDEVSELKRTSGLYIRSVTYKYQDIKADRDRSAKLFEPLQVFFYLDSLQQSVSSNAIHNIQLALRKIELYIESTFQVRKRERPYVLERQSCTQKWQSGKNKGKCSKFVNKTEICASTGIYHEIPDRFLDKLEIYDFDASKPRYSIIAGPGLLDSNFIVFVTSQTSSICEETDVSAYGTYCRLHPKTNEPLAGVLNLCPLYFTKKIYAFQHYYNVILHEVFHILGFTHYLFEKFLPCEKGTYCDIPKNVIQEDDNGTVRMMFPLVIENTQNHFGCSKPDYGGPMAINEQSDNSSNELTSTSHWHPILMFSSIMTPSFSEYDHIFVDNITLAVFASTGWYRVNFANADNFRFGQEQGCDFGMNSSCENSMYLCNPSDNTTGCDLVHKTIGTCTNLTSSHPCGIFQPYTKENCESDLDKQFGLDFYSLGYQLKCFMLQEPESDYIPSCLPVKCKTEETYIILVNMTWYPCEEKNLITVNDSSVYCPESFLVCPSSEIQSKRLFCPAEKFFFIAVKMYFSLPGFENLSNSQNFKNFKVTTVRGIAEKINVPVNYIVNASLSVFKQISLDFAVCPPSSLSASELNGILLKTQEFLDDGSFMHVLKGPANMIISSNDIKIDPVEGIAFSDHEGFRVLIIFPIICAIFLIVTFVASILRLFLIQKHRPWRTLESTDNTQMAEVNPQS